MEWEALTNLRAFVLGDSQFGSVELRELTFLLCARQMELGKLAIWIDADEEVNPISIEIFDDEFGLLSAEDLQTQMIELFAQDSDQISQEFVQFSEESELAQYEVSFPTEDADLEAWLNEITIHLHPVLESYVPEDIFEANLKQFCLQGMLASHIESD
jgi:hypothetical protein